MNALPLRAVSRGQEMPSYISSRDALLLAIKNWAWLVFCPSIIMVLVSAIYFSLPTNHSAFAVLNLDLNLLKISSKIVVDELDPSTTVQIQQNDADTVIVTSTSRDSARALAAVQNVIEHAPEPVSVPSSLTPEQSLELRALLQYQSALLDGAVFNGVASTMLDEEMAKVKNRVQYLELKNVSSKAPPKIAHAATVVAMRLPPTRNVAIFSFCLTLFGTWMIILDIERRRVLRASTVGRA